MKDHAEINLFHIFLVAPLLFSVGYMKKDNPDMLFNLLMVISIIVLLYHTYRLYNKLMN